MDQLCFASLNEAHNCHYGEQLLLMELSWRYRYFYQCQQHISVQDEPGKQDEIV